MYFAVDKLPSYGQLSKRKLDDMMAGARIEVDEHKRHPMDFALWKASKPGEPEWDSPWGPGRPGWHIECSAMASKYLGQPFDIHGGGNDLIFPHHENEIAQSEGAKGRQLARYWLHNGMVNLGAEKMSKSLGNVWTVADAARQVGGEALRLLVLGTHYRGPLDFQPDRLLETKRTARPPVRDPGARRRAPCASTARRRRGDSATRSWPTSAPAWTTTSTPRAALATVFDAMRALNRHLDDGELEPRGGLPRRHRDDRRRARHRRPESARLPGARQSARHWKRASCRRPTSSACIAERAAARRAKNFKRADEIRGELKAQGVILEDSAAGHDLEDRALIRGGATPRQHRPYAAPSSAMLRLMRTNANSSSVP